MFVTGSGVFLLLDPFLQVHPSAYPYYYCAFYKHANSKVQKPPSQLRFSLPSIIITITINEPRNTETQKMDQTPPFTNHKRGPFELVKEIFYFLRRP